jgi:hypothetical protein
MSLAAGTNELRDQIISGIESVYGFTFTPAQKIEAQKLWGVVEAAIDYRLKNRVDLVLAAGIPVNAGTFVANTTTGVITGQGVTVAQTQSSPNRIA